MTYPTNPIRIANGNVPGSTGGDTKIGSATIPQDKHGQITGLRLFTGSADTWFDITHSNEGTVDINYFEASGGESDLRAIDKPIDSVSPGTVEIWVRSSSTDQVYGAKARIDLC